MDWPTMYHGSSLIMPQSQNPYEDSPNPEPHSYSQPRPSKLLTNWKHTLLATRYGLLQHSHSDRVNCWCQSHWLGAVLAQKSQNANSSGEVHIVAYASRALTDVETWYSQTEKEGLAIIWGCERFHLYLYGSTFNLITDHKALELIFRNLWSHSFWYCMLGNIRNIFLRNTVFVGSIGFRMLWQVVGWISIARAVCDGDYYCKRNSHCSIRDPWGNHILNMNRSNLASGWSMSPVTEMAHSNVNAELTDTSEGLLLRRTRIVIQQTLQTRYVQLAHKGHKGSSRPKPFFARKSGSQELTVK